MCLSLVTYLMNFKNSFLKYVKNFSRFKNTYIIKISSFKIGAINSMLPGRGSIWIICNTLILKITRELDAYFEYAVPSGLSQVYIRHL